MAEKGSHPPTDGHDTVLGLVTSKPDQGQSVLGKLTQRPLASFGMAGWLGAVGYGLYKFKSRPKGMPASLYIIHMRMGAQGIVIGTLTLGMCAALGMRLKKMYYGEPITEFGEDRQEYVPPILGNKSSPKKIHQ